MTFINHIVLLCLCLVPWCACDVLGERPSLWQAVVIPNHVLSRRDRVVQSSGLCSQQRQTADDEPLGYI